MKTFYLEQKTADFLITDESRYTIPEVVSRSYNRRMSFKPPRISVAIVPDFIPVTPAEVRRKSLENEALLARLKAARRKMTLMTTIVSSKDKDKDKETLAKAIDATNRDRLSKDEKKESSAISRFATFAGPTSRHHATARPALEGKAATSCGLYERLNAALSARRQTGESVESVDSRTSSQASHHSACARSCALL